MQELFKVFSNFADLPPAKRGADLMTLFRDIEERNDSFMREAFEGLLEVLSLPGDHPLAEAGKVIAELIDSKSTAENYGGHGNAYHNRNHMFEVPTSLAALLKIHEARGYEPAFDTEDKLVMLVAALAHDLGHNGKGNGLGRNRVPLMMEQHSIELAKPIIRAFYKDDAEFNRVFNKIEAIISATDIGGELKAPGKFFADFAKYHAGELTEPPQAPFPQMQKFVSLLKDDPKLAQMCIMMQDADLLPSIALTIGWAEKQNARLTQELNKGKGSVVEIDFENIDYRSASYFYENLASLKSRAGKEFQINFNAIKQDAHLMHVDVSEFKMSG